MVKSIKEHEDKYIHIRKKPFGRIIIFSIMTIVFWSSVFWITSIPPPSNLFLMFCVVITVLFLAMSPLALLIYLRSDR